MRHRTLLLMLGSLVFAACGDAASPAPATGTVVRFAFESRPADTIRVLITDAATLQAARDYIRTGQGAHIPIGTIEPGAGIDARFPFHFLPETVRLAELAIEVCDGAPMRTTNEVAEFIRGASGGSSRATWCPWSAFPVRVEE